MPVTNPPSSNSPAVPDNTFKIVDDVDATKAIEFSVGGNTTGKKTTIVSQATQDRVVTLQNKDIVVAGTSDISGFTSTVSTGVAINIVADSNPIQELTGTVASDVIFADPSTLANKQQFRVINNASVDITVFSVDFSVIYIIPVGTAADFIVRRLSGTTAASWIVVPHVSGLAFFSEISSDFSGMLYNQLTPKGAINAFTVMTPLGTGGFSLQVPNFSVAGGNARGVRSVDFGLIRSTASQVASGANSRNFADYGKASNTASINYAYLGISSGIGSGNFGYDGTSAGSYSINTGFKGYAFAHGESTHSSGQFAVLGDAQRRELVLRARTTSATSVALTADQGAAGSLNQLVLQNNQSVTAQVLVVAKKTGTTASTAHFKLTVCATRGTSAASTVLHIAPVIETFWNPDGVTIATTVDAVNGAITFAATTPAGTWNTVIDVFAISTIIA